MVKPRAKPKNKLLREQIPAGECLCDYCVARCCRYLALPIDTPTTWNDYDDIRWYLAHENISIFVDDGSWYIMILNRCSHLAVDNRCNLYHDRMRICREYTTDNCEYDEEYTYDQIFETDAQIWEYAEAILGPAVPKPSALLSITTN